MKKYEFAIPAAGALIFNPENKIFLMKSSGKFGQSWIVAGGKIAFGESMEKALSREIFEETGIEIVHSSLQGVREFINDDKHFIFLEFLAYATGNDIITLNYEADEYGWFTKTEALNLNLAQPTRDFIEQRI